MAIHPWDMLRYPLAVPDTCTLAHNANKLFRSDPTKWVFTLQPRGPKLETGDLVLPSMRFLSFWPSFYSSRTSWRRWHGYICCALNLYYPRYILKQAYYPLRIPCKRVPNLHGIKPKPTVASLICTLPTGWASGSLGYKSRVGSLELSDCQATPPSRTDL